MLKHKYIKNYRVLWGKSRFLATAREEIPHIVPHKFGLLAGFLFFCTFLWSTIALPRFFWETLLLLLAYYIFAIFSLFPTFFHSNHLLRYGTRYFGLRHQSSPSAATRSTCFILSSSLLLWSNFLQIRRTQQSLLPWAQRAHWSQQLTSVFCQSEQSNSNQILCRSDLCKSLFWLNSCFSPSMRLWNGETYGPLQLWKRKFFCCAFRVTRLFKPFLFFLT